MDNSDLIPPSFVVPPFSLEHPFAVWQAFAVRAVLPGLAFNLSLAGLAVGLSRWVDVPLTLISIAGMATFGGLLKGLLDSFDDSRHYANTVIATYTSNARAYRTYLTMQVQVNQVKAGKGSSVNISQTGQTEVNDASAEARATFTRHVSEFRRMIMSGKDLRREDWLAHRGQGGTPMPAFQWSDGSRITRAEYDDIVSFYQNIGYINDRSKGRKGESTALSATDVTP